MITAETLENLLKLRRDRNWEQFHTFKNIAISIFLEAAELLEHVQWIPDSQVSDTVAEKIEEVSAEIADIAIYLTYLSHDLGIDLEQAVKTKLLINEVKYPIDKSRGKALKYDKLP